jgi:hypothetical protein
MVIRFKIFCYHDSDKGSNPKIRLKTPLFQTLFYFFAGRHAGRSLLPSVTLPCFASIETGIGFNITKENREGKQHSNRKASRKTARIARDVKKNNSKPQSHEAHKARTPRTGRK